MVAVPLEVDVHRRRRVIARSERITLPDVALRRAITHHRHGEGKRHAAVLPDTRRGAQDMPVVEQVRRMVFRTTDDAHARAVLSQTAHDRRLRIIAEAGKPRFVSQ